ncbi:hypothetical protein EV426DRAFT_716960 [Tirmania nivea]|nr:hypothetical protein EV426DRAFT_716960 [Tirmania nivea]
MSSCPSSPGPNLGNRIPKTPPFLEDFDLSDFPLYSEKSYSDTSSVLDLPDIDFPTSHINTPSLDLTPANGFSSNIRTSYPPRVAADTTGNSESKGSNSKEENSLLPNEYASSSFGSASRRFGRYGSYGVGMPFINFTPQDAAQIMSGVAPSGGAKTKARRKREAKEKQQKLIEAASAAVRAVGGDSSQLPIT